jgi:hypothetical protein
MAGRFSRVRRAAYLAALLVSLFAFAYSLAGIAGTGSELQSAVNARSAERAAPVVHRPADETHEDCPGRDEADRVEL